MLAMKKLVFVGLSLFALSPFNPAHAALFDDKEARKKIVELEAKQQSDHSATMAAIADLKKSQAAMEKRIAAMEAVVQGQGLADMSNQIEALKQEVANLKGHATASKRFVHRYRYKAAQARRWCASSVKYRAGQCAYASSG
jgi:hypothetical protein